MSEKLNTNFAEISEYRQDAEWFANETREIQQQFGRYLDQNQDFREADFLRWEDDFKYNYQRMDENIYKMNASFDDYAEIAVKSIAYPGSGHEKDLKKTIEAQSGNFFYERRNALIRAIKDSSSSDDQKSEDLAKIDDFVIAVQKHISFKYMPKTEISRYGSERYDSMRTSIHNDTIKKLNGLNDLCNSYSVRPLTPRKFCPSDIKEPSSQTPAEVTIMNYDRHIVEEYYALAFPTAIAKAEAELRQEMGYF